MSKKRPMGTPTFGGTQGSLTSGDWVVPKPVIKTLRKNGKRKIKK